MRKAEVNQAEHLFQAVKYCGSHSGVSCNDEGDLSCHTLLSVIRRAQACQRIQVAYSFLCYSAGWHDIYTVATVSVNFRSSLFSASLLHSAFFTGSCFSCWAVVLDWGQLQKQHLLTFSLNCLPNLRRKQAWCLCYLSLIVRANLQFLLDETWWTVKPLILDWEKKKLVDNSNFKIVTVF